MISKWISRIFPKNADGLFTRLFKNAGLMFSGNVISSLLGLVSTALTARGLGVAAFGVLAVIRAYVLLIDRLVSFQSWQALIHYGADSLEKNKPQEFKQLVAFSTLLDVSTAVLGTGIALAGLRWVGPWQRWDPLTVQMAVWYSFSLLFNLSSTPKGILRLFNRFQLFAAQQIVAAVFKLTCVAIAFASGAGPRAFLAIWISTDVLGYLLLFACAWAELIRRGFASIFTSFSIREVAHRCPGIWGFVWATNLNLSLRNALKEFDTLLVGGMLGNVAAGLYQVARQCTKMIDQIADPLDEAVFPELAKLSARRDIKMMSRVMWRVSLASTVASGLIWMGLVILGKPFLHMAFGLDFIGAYPVLIWYVLGIAISTVTFSWESGLLAVGRSRWLLLVNTTSSALYLVALILLLQSAGLVGAGMANVVQHIVLSLVLLSSQWTVFRQKSSSAGMVRPVVPVEDLRP